MNKLLFALSAIFILANYGIADVRIASVYGNVSVFHNAQWQPASAGMELGEKDVVKTLPDSRASLLVNEATFVWVSRNSQVEVSSLDKGSVFTLLLGRLRAKVRNLQGSKFQIKTPVSVASVRGTDFAVDAAGILNVFEGHVDFSDLNLAQIVEVVAGQINEMRAGQPGATRAMTPEEQAAAALEWSGFSGDPTKQGTSGDDKKKETKNDAKNDITQMRQELHDIVNGLKTDINTTRETTNEVKEADLASGRTLRDVNGNVVRVEQQLLRPDAASIQLINLTKRSNYTYTDRQGWVRSWGETIPSTSRLDVAMVQVNMNMALPSQLTDWPAFIQSKGDALHPQTVSMKMTNQTDTIENDGIWKLKGQPDSKGKPLQDDGMVFDSYINGWKVDQAYNGTGEIDRNGSANNDLWAWTVSPDVKVDKNGVTKYLRLYTEAYVINNNGNIVNLADITNSSENPFSFFKTLAAEDIIFAREITNQSTGSTIRFFTGSNIDLVITPDIVISVAEKLVSQTNNLQTDNASNTATGNNSNHNP